MTGTVTIDGLPPAAAVGGTESLPLSQSGTTVQTPVSAILTYIITHLSQNTGGTNVGINDGSAGALFTTLQGMLNTLQSNSGSALVGLNDGVSGASYTNLNTFISQLMQGLGSNGALPTRAQLLTYHVPPTITTLVTSGFNTPGDEGGAIFTRTSTVLNDGASFQSADGSYWLLSNHDINIAMFGAVGGVGNSVTNYRANLPDDTTAIQNCINFCLNNGKTVYIPARQYRITQSLNCGKVYPFTGRSIHIVGANMNSRIIADLSEYYPALDFTNQNRGILETIWFESTTTSMHSCLLLFAETQASGTNMFSMKGCTVQDIGSSSKISVFGYSADQFNFENTQIGSIASGVYHAVYFGLANPGNITSKFYTIASSSSDATLLMGHNSSFMCATGPGLFCDGFDQVNMFGCYFNVESAYNQYGAGHFKGMFRVKSTPSISTQRFSKVNLIGCRFEDQALNNLPPSPTVTFTGSITPNSDGQTSTLTITSIATGTPVVGQLLTSSGPGFATNTTLIAQVSSNVWTVTYNQTVSSTTFNSYLVSSPCVYIDDYVYGSTFEGAFQTSGSGVFGGPGQHINSRVSINSVVLSPWFHGSGGLIGGQFHFTGGGNSIGLFDTTNSRGYTMGGRIGTTWAGAFALIKNSVSFISDDWTIEGSAPAWISGGLRVIGQNSNSPTNYRIGLKGETSFINTVSYTGGAGTQVVGTFSTAAAGMLAQSISTATLVSPIFTVKFHGTFSTSLAAGTAMTLTVSQALTSGTVSLAIASLSSIPAYGAAKGWTASVMMTDTGNAFNIRTTMTSEGSAPVSDAEAFVLSSYGFDPTSSVPLVFTISVASPTSNPLGATFMAYIE